MIESALRQFFHGEGFTILDQPRPPEQIGIRRKGNVAIVTLDFLTGRQTVVVKNIRKNVHQKTPDELLTAYRFITARDPILQRSLTKILGINPARGWIIMEYIPGFTFERVLLNKIILGGDVDRYFVDVARILGAMRQIKPAEAGVVGQSDGAALAVEELSAALADPAIRRYLPDDLTCPKAFFSRFNGDFLSRRRENLVFADCQPKNIILADSGELRLIDPDFNVTSITLAAAQFLTSLDRLGLYLPLPGMAARIHRWQRCFIDACRQWNDPAFQSDLAFWYTTNLLRVYVRHAAQRKAFRPYLRWFYGNRLRRFLMRTDAALGPARQRIGLACGASGHSTR